MAWGIVVDSCCDVTPELRSNYGITAVPLTISLGDRHVADDEQLDLPQFLDDMRRHEGKVATAAPSPTLFKEAFMKSKKAFGVTLSSNLSGSYASAKVGMEMAEEEGAEVHVFDSKSASAGEVLIALKIGEMIRTGLEKAEIVETIEAFIKKMKTYFVIENIDNLLKNGRMNKITGKIITVLGIKPIMGSDGDGNIALFSHARSELQVIDKLAATIKQSNRSVEGQPMVIAHCNNPTLAQKLKDEISRRYRFSGIHIVPMRGISSVYANDKGLVMAF